MEYAITILENELQKLNQSLTLTEERVAQIEGWMQDGEDPEKYARNLEEQKELAEELQEKISDLQSALAELV